jgi:hypothetical protein
MKGLRWKPGAYLILFFKHIFLQFFFSVVSFGIIAGIITAGKL